MKHVLIAHQSTIPHYRIPFYNTLERLRPPDWDFKVVFDPKEFLSPIFFREKLQPADFHFPIQEVNTIRSPLFGKSVCYQTFWRQISGLDLVILENAVNNLTYPLSHLHKLNGTRIVYWGHGQHRAIEKESRWKSLSELLKYFLVQYSDGFFAYTQGVANYLISQGIQPAKIFVLNNTIDILEQRAAYQLALPLRDVIRRKYHLEDKKVLLFVGRLHYKKRIDFLLRSFEILNKIDSRFHLMLIGIGGEAYQNQFQLLSNLSYLGSITSLEEIAPLFTASDLFIIPGLVGLAPLQAMCYDLPIVSINLPGHGPEIEYLSSSNSIILDSETTPEKFALAVHDLFCEPNRLEVLKSCVWPSIQHLTIENMAENFIRGVNYIFNIQNQS